jgi:hypothetical protein
LVCILLFALSLVPEYLRLLITSESHLEADFRVLWLLSLLVAGKRMSDESSAAARGVSVELDKNGNV